MNEMYPRIKFTSITDIPDHNNHNDDDDEEDDDAGTVLDV